MKKTKHRATPAVLTAAVTVLLVALPPPVNASRWDCTWRGSESDSWGTNGINTLPPTFIHTVRWPVPPIVVEPTSSLPPQIAAELEILIARSRTAFLVDSTAYYDDRTAKNGVRGRNEWAKAGFDPARCTTDIAMYGTGSTELKEYRDAETEACGHSGTGPGGEVYFDWYQRLTEAYTGSATITDDNYSGSTAASVTVRGESYLTIVYESGTVDTTPRPIIINVDCAPTAEQLTATLYPDVAFGAVSLSPGAQASTALHLSITSGLKYPEGTLTFSSSKTDSAGRISLGGGGKCGSWNKPRGMNTTWMSHIPLPLVTRRLLLNSTRTVPPLEKPQKHSRSI